MKAWKAWRKEKGKEKGFKAPNKWKRQKTNRKYYLNHSAEIREQRRKYREDHRKRINARRRTLYHRSKSKDAFVVSNA